IAYIFDVNNAVLTGATSMYKFKQLLKTAVWTVLSSSDGTTYNSGADIITSGAAGANGFGNNSAWVRIQMPTANSVNREFTLQRSTTNTTWTIKYSYSAGFIGGSPNATTTPTATDSQTLLNASTLFNTDSTYRLNIGADNASPDGFWMGCFPSGGGNPNSGFCMIPMNYIISGDIDPYVFYIDGAASAFSASQFSATNNNKAWVMKGLTYQAWQTVGGCTLDVGSSGQVTIPSTVGANPHNSNDDVFDILYGNQEIQGTYPLGYKGISSMIKWNGSSRTTGDTLSVASAGAKDRIVYRDT